MSTQLTKAQIDQLKVVLAQVGLDVKPMPKPRVNDWITERELAIKAVTMKRQSAFWKTAQLRNLKTRRQISPEYEAFISGR